MNSTATALTLASGAAVLHALWSLVSKRLAEYDAVAFVWLASLGSFVAYAPVVLLLTGGDGGWRLTPVQLAECRLLVLGAATLIPLPYLLFLFALRLAPAALVSPVREASVLLVVLLGGTLLAEGRLRARLLAAGVIVTGLSLIAFG
ncbi:hypothetical protein GCM10020229_53100 [Kitasatospora albolonga]|uniref:EamA family transporter n=1 Tax=Kitasatospora albolonga TaxID=68173 RepID=UPI0031F1C204